MNSLLSLIIFLNVVFFLLIASFRLSRPDLARAVVLLWISLNVVFLYFVFGFLGGSNPFFGFYGIQLPLFCALIGSMIIVGLARFAVTHPHKTYLIIVMFVMVCGGLFLRYLDGLAMLGDNTGTDLLQTVYAMAFIVAFSLCLLSPMTAFFDREDSIASKVFFGGGYHGRANIGILISVTAGSLFTWILATIVTKGILIEFYLISPLKSLIISAILDIFYFSLIDQFVCIVLAKYVIDTLFKGEETTMWEIVLYAGLFAGFHYYLQPVLIIREFILGLLLAYLYLRTRSLLYGVAIHSVLWTFTIPV